MQAATSKQLDLHLTDLTDQCVPPLSIIIVIIIIIMRAYKALIGAVRGNANNV